MLEEVRKPDPGENAECEVTSEVTQDMSIYYTPHDPWEWKYIHQNTLLHASIHIISHICVVYVLWFFVYVSYLIDEKEWRFFESLKKKSGINNH